MKTYDDCAFCGGRVSERNVKKACFWGEELVAMVDRVPAGVCEQCGEKYYKIEVLKGIEKILNDRKSLAVNIQIPLADFAIAGS